MAEQGRTFLAATDGPGTGSHGVRGSRPLSSTNHMRHLRKSRKCLFRFRGHFRAGHPFGFPAGV